MEKVHQTVPCQDQLEENDYKIPLSEKERLRLFKRSCFAKVSDLVFSQCRATSASDLKEAYRLVYEVYLSSGYIKPQKNMLRMRVFELCPETATFVSKSSSCTIIGAISVIEDSSDLKLPSDAVFPVEMSTLRNDTSHLCEFSNQAVMGAFRGTGVAVELMRCAFAHAVHEGYTDIICSVSPQVVPFYQMVGFEKKSIAKGYCSKTNDEVILMILPNIQTRFLTNIPSRDEVFECCKDLFFVNNIYLSNIDIWNILNLKMFSEQFEIASLFALCKDVFQKSSRSVLSFLAHRLGPIYELVQAAVEKDRRFSFIYKRTSIRRSMPLRPRLFQKEILLSRQSLPGPSRSLIQFPSRSSSILKSTIPPKQSKDPGRIHM